MVINETVINGNNGKVNDIKPSINFVINTALNCNKSNINCNKFSINLY